MTQKWNLQDIRPAEPRTKRRPTSNDMSERPIQRRDNITANQSQPRRPRESGDENEDFDDITPIKVTDGRKSNRNHLAIAVVIFIVVIAGGFLISSLTGGAEVSIHPKVKELNVNAEFSAYKDKRAGELSYEIMTLEATGERQVTATGQEEVTIQATGEIEIIKTTPGAERLIKNTRFATADGLVFRIQESVVVPGALTNSSGENVPGTIRAQVFADEAGEKYNIPANTKLNVPGFKEGGFTELYNAIYAENRVAFNNGFAGPRFIINEDELGTARQSLQMELRDALLARIANEKPADFTSFSDAIALTYNALTPVQYGDNLVTIREQAILQIPLFKDSDFASFIAQETIVGYEGDGVRIDNLENITFAYSVATTSQSNIANLDEINFKVTGVPRIVWTFDEGKMKVDLLGAEKTAFIGVLGQYPGIEKGEVKVRPFWKRTFPTEMDKIKIIEVLSTQ